MSNINRALLKNNPDAEFLFQRPCVFPSVMNDEALRRLQRLQEIWSVTYGEDDEGNVHYLTMADIQEINELLYTR